MVTAQGLRKTLDPLFLYQIEPELSTPKKLGFLYSAFANILVTLTVVRVPLT